MTDFFVLGDDGEILVIPETVARGNDNEITVVARNAAASAPGPSTSRVQCTALNDFIGREIEVLNEYALRSTVRLTNPGAMRRASRQITAQPNLAGLYHTDWGAADPGHGRVQVDMEMITQDSGWRVRNSIFVKSGEGLDAYFLPWDSRGGVVYMTLPRGDSGGPRHFFTADLSGCSILVTGPPDNPTIWHGGVENWNNSGYADNHDGNVPARDESPRLWGSLVEHLSGQAAGNITAIDKTDYINDFARAPNRPLKDLAGKLKGILPRRFRGEKPIFSGQTLEGTERSRATEKALQKQEGKDASAVPFGSVFGLWDNDQGVWKLYLQENATLTSSKDAPRNRTLRLRQFFPAQ